MRISVEDLVDCHVDFTERTNPVLELMAHVMVLCVAGASSKTTKLLLGKSVGGGIQVLFSLLGKND